MAENWLDYLKNVSVGKKNSLELDADLYRQEKESGMDLWPEDMSWHRAMSQWHGILAKAHGISKGEFAAAVAVEEFNLSRFCADFWVGLNEKKGTAVILGDSFGCSISADGITPAPDLDVSLYEWECPSEAIQKHFPEEKKYRIKKQSGSTHERFVRMGWEFPADLLPALLDWHKLENKKGKNHEKRNGKII